MKDPLVVRQPVFPEFELQAEEPVETVEQQEGVLEQEQVRDLEQV